MEKMSTRRALPGEHASRVSTVDVYARCRCLDAPLLRAHLHVPAVTHKVSNQTLAHALCSLVRLCHETCHLFHSLLLARIVALLNVDAESLSSFVSICGVHSCTFHRWSSLTSHFHRPDSSAQARFSRLRESASISIWSRDPERHTQVTNRFRIVTILSSPSSGFGIARFQGSILQSTPLALNRPC